jgi:Flp pilus assembly protein protease CpaA
LIFYDLKEKQVPVFLVAWFATFLVLISWYHYELHDFILRISYVGIGLALAWHLLTHKLGRADMIIIGAIIIYLPVQTIPYFLLICGALGLIFAFLWYLLYKESDYPFMPVILVTFWVQLFLEGRV